MRWLTALLCVGLVACGSEPTEPEPDEEPLDTLTLSGRWDMTRADGEELPVPTGDTVTCDDGVGGRDTARRMWAYGSINFGPDSARATLATRYECGGITNVTEVDHEGAYTAREDSIFFELDPRNPSLRRAGWTRAAERFRTVGGEFELTFMEE